MASQAPPTTPALFRAVTIAIDEVDVKSWYEVVSQQNLNEIAPISSIYDRNSEPAQVYEAVAGGSILLLLHAGGVQEYARGIIAALSQVRDLGRPAVLLIQVTQNASPSGAVQSVGDTLLKVRLHDVQSALKDIVSGLPSGGFTPLSLFAPRLLRAIMGATTQDANARQGTGKSGSSKIAHESKSSIPSDVDQSGSSGQKRTPEEDDDEETAADNAGPATNVRFDQLNSREFSQLAWQILEVARRMGEGRPRAQASVRRLLAAMVLSGLRRKGDERTGSWLVSLIKQEREELRRPILERYPAAARHKGSFDAMLNSKLPVSQTMTRALFDVLETAKRLSREARPGVPLVIGARHLLGAAVRQDERDTTARRTLKGFGLNLDDVRRNLLDRLPAWRLDDDQDAWRFVLEPTTVEVERRLPIYAADSAIGPDMIGITREVEAMASLVSAWSVEPPLSIGLFGEWGSGKSFFMRKMKERVKQIAIEARKSSQAQREFGYYKNIVQVEFNAWHYVEGNLWASLVEHIFTNLRFEGTVEEDLDSEKNIQDRLDKMLRLLRERTSDADAKGIEAQKLEADARVSEERANTANADAKNAKATADQAELASKAAMQTAIDTHAKAQDTSELRRTLLTKDIIEEIKLAPEVRSELESDLEKLGVTKERLQTVQGFRDAIRDATDTGKVLAEGLHLVRRDSGWLLVIWAVAVPVAVFLIGWVVDRINANWLQHIETTLSVVTGLMTGIIASWKKLKSRLQPLVDLIQRIKKKQAALETSVEAERQKRAEEAAKLETDVIRMRSEAEAQRRTAAEKEAEAVTARQEAERHKAAAEKAAKDAADARSNAEALAREAEALAPERRIATFIQDRAAASDYRRHLGVPALIRRDFEKLSAMFETQRNKEERGEDCGAGNRQNDPTVVNRIILYIDDLDRCPPEKVVDVLRAIHLLLAFRLFVVVVAVDARWMKRSLKDRFSLMLSSPDGRPEPVKGRKDDVEEENIAWRATASPDDYLEKIFQVPFWIRPLGRSGSRRLISELTQHDVEIAPPSPGLATNGGSVNSNGEQNGNVGGERVSSEGNASSPTGGIQSSNVNPVSGSNASTEQKVASVAANKVVSEWSPIEAKPRTLMLTREERDYMVNLSSVIGRSPRSVKRFVNCYRLLKSTLDAAELERASKTGTFRTPMLLLGIVTGFPEAAPALLSDLRDAPRSQSPETWARAAAKQFHLEDRGKWADLLPLIDQLRLWEVKTIAPLVDAAVLVDRFSFSPVQRPIEDLV